MIGILMAQQNFFSIVNCCRNIYRFSNNLVSSVNSDHYVPNNFKIPQQKNHQHQIQSQIPQIPWYPKKLDDLDQIGRTLLNITDVNGYDSLQFTDPVYRKRREYIGDIAKAYKIRDPIPYIEYLPSQNKTWAYCFEKLRKIHKKVMCQMYEKNMQKLEEEFKMDDKIPQINALSDYLTSKSNFRFKLTHGILTQRQFFNSLAHRVFCCTQFIRHPSLPQYTQQPDIIHEIIGHMPMLINEEVADISQLIGLYSLGATDEQIVELGCIYWWIIQFGVCKEKGMMRAYGAGIAGSIGQQQNFISGKPKFEELLPARDTKIKLLFQQLQPIYKFTNSLEEAMRLLKQYGKTIKKKVNMSYNSKTKSIITELNENK